MNQMLRESEEQMKNNDTSRYKQILSQQQQDLEQMTLQIEAKEQQFIKMREQIEAQDKVYNQQSLIYQNEQKDEYQ